jgi:class 3 adenylate cyclase
VAPRSHCPACDISFDLDFGEHVEAVFHVSASIRNVHPQVYCASSPWFRPHVFAQLPIAAGASREVQAPLPRGPLLVRVIPGARRARVHIYDPGPRAMRLQITPKELGVQVSTEPADNGESRIIAVNETDKDVVVLVERVGANADVVLGSVIATLPDFHDLFSTEAPAAGADLSIRALTILFSDLTGSTALYEKVGDARAFALIKEHFEAMAIAVEGHQGAIVKTMGDAVMATFPSPEDALRAGVEMVEATRREHGSSGMSLKVGLHEGPCLAVRANDRLDFFGTTVNIAARLQAQARPGEIVVASELLAHDGVSCVVRDRKMTSRAFEASLKGVSRAQKLVGLIV